MYAYDSCGNILSRTKYGYTDAENPAGGTVTAYEYNNAAWGDQLTSRNGESITYDAIGNPLSYRGRSLTWTQGRRLAGITAEGLNVTYTYDESGTRTGKTVNGVSTQYYINGSQILAQKSGEDILYFLYDETGAAVGFKYNNNLYLYRKNLQGDILAVLNGQTGAVEASYTYDAWGRVISSTGALSELNPFRYRGYYYDSETGMYYISSRYYDPEVGRFIIADDSEILFEEQNNFLQYNLFAYRFNNPVNMLDPAGESPANIIGGIIGGVAGAALGYLLADALGLKGWKKWALVAAATVGGAVLGAFLGPYVAKLGGKIAAKLGIQTAARQTIKMSSGRLWKGSAKHIFSKEHISKGIMRLGGSQRAIFNKIYKVVNSNLANAVEGSNQIHTTINGVKTTIRFYVSNGEVQNINAMTGWATRIIGKLL